MFDIQVNGRDIRLYREGIFGPAKKQMQEMASYINGKVAGTTLKKKLGRLASLAVNRNVSEQRDSSGQPWQPLTQATQKIRQKLGYAAGPPLLRSGDMLRSATGPQRVTFSRDGILIQPRVGRFTQQNKYALHNRPSDDWVDNPIERFGPIPGREFYYLSDEDARVVAQILLSDLKGRLDKLAKGKTQEGVALNMQIEKLSGIASQV